MLFLKMFLGILLCACLGLALKKNTESDAGKFSAPLQQTASEGEESGCNFEIDAMEMFTTDAIKSYDHHLAYTWDSAHHFATIPFPNGAQMILQIGGCDVFNYAVAYKIPNNDSFLNTSYILDKVKWMTRSFFTSGFDTKYTQCIDQGLFYLDTLASNDNKRTYRLINKDTSSVTNQIFKGFGVRKTIQGMEIWANGFFE